MCRRSFIFPWDFDRHLDSLHSKCKVCQQYLVNKEMLLDHMDLEHPTVTPEPVVTEDQVTEDPATLEANCQDCQVKCKYCDRHFKNIAKCNMHVNRRHKRVKCSQCEKRFVKQADCDNHFRDVHEFVCSISGCLVIKNNEAELHEHLRHDHVKICHLCHRIFVSDDKLFDHMKETHPEPRGHTQEELREDERARVHAVWKWFDEMQRKEKEGDS